MFDGFVASSSFAGTPEGQVLWFLFSGTRLFVTIQEQRVSVPFVTEPDRLGVRAGRPLHLGTLHGSPCYAAGIAGENEPNLTDGFLLRELRSLYSELDEGLFRLAETAVHLIEWDKNTHYCGRCRTELVLRMSERSKECPSCGRLEFPRISPAIIVLIERDDKILLARAARFTEGWYSILAGFVEPGESLEETVRREIREEVGIEIKDIRYFGSQPWPFPDSLMIGFTAVYAGGEISIDGKEIVEAAWYDLDHLPRIPGRMSIARKLIDRFIETHSEETPFGLGEGR